MSAHLDLVYVSPLLAIGPAAVVALLLTRGPRWLAVRFLGGPR